MRWITFPDAQLEVNGLPWFAENQPELWRLPLRMKKQVRLPVWDLATHPSGGRIRFATDAVTLAIRLFYEKVGHMNNMCRIGQMGVDLYVDGAHWLCAFPTQVGQMECTYFTGMPRQRREITLYLPLYHPVKVVAIGVDDKARLWPARPFAVPKPVAFYGSSITQGGCASRAGLSYQAILGRALNLDFVNLGFSGNGKGEPELAAALAEIDAAAFVIDFAVNCDSVEACQKVYAPFLAIIRKKHPHVPIICITPIFATQEIYSEASRAKWAGLRQVVRDAVAARKAGGDKRITLVEGVDLLGPKDSDGLVDSAHPNDIGFARIAQRLEAVVGGALELKSA